MNNTTRKWVVIDDPLIKNNYEINRDGEIRNSITGKILVQSIDSYGYKVIALQTVDGRRVTRKVHRLVLITFVGYSLDPAKTTVNHINGIKTDNRLCNLEWASLSDQQRHSIDTGLKTIGYGNKSPHSVYSEDTIRVIKRMLAEGKKPSEISIATNIPNDKKLHSLIYRIRSNRHWNTIN